MFRFSIAPHDRHVFPQAGRSSPTVRVASWCWWLGTHRRAPACWLLVALLLLCSALPARAQDAPVRLTRAQKEQQSDLLLRYGTRLMEVNDRYDLFNRLRDLATQEQIDAVSRLRISPSQLEKLIRLVQDNPPPEGMDDAMFKEWRRKLTPKFEDILGSEQFDTLLELVPSPQQRERAKNLFKEAANTPEGQLAWQASQELSSSLTADQRSWMQPFLDLARPDPQVTGQPAPVEAVASTTVTQRRLVFLRRTSTGDFFAENFATADYTRDLPARLRVKGGDPGVLTAVSNSFGVPVRLLGTYKDDVVTVGQTALFGPPPVMPARAGGDNVWRGYLPARVVSQNPPAVEMDAGRGRKITAELELNEDERRAFDQVAAAGQPFLLGGTCMTLGDKNTVADVEFLPWQPQENALGASCLVQLPQEFLNRAASEYIKGHPDKFNFEDSAGKVSVRVTDLGLSLRGCQGSQVRLYGAASLAHSGVSMLEGQFEIVTDAKFAGQKLELKPVLGTMKLRITYPMTGEAPESWIKNIETMLGAEYAQGTSLAVPESAREDVVKTGLLDNTQLDSLKLLTHPTRDRRTSWLVVAAPPANPQAPAVDVLRSRIEAPGEFAVALSDEAVTAALRKKVPEMLPLKRPIPEDLQDQEGATLTELQVPELDLSFEKGVFRINDCAVHVRWHFALFSGVEPAFRFKGTAQVISAGDPIKLTARIKVESLEFLTDQITGRPADEQQKIKDKIIKAMEERTFELPDPGTFSLTEISARTKLCPTSIKGTEVPSELLLQGKLDP